MPILNYTTTVQAQRSTAHIQKLLTEFGATSILIDIDANKRISSMSFKVNTKAGLLAFQMPANIDGVHAMLVKSRIVTRLKTKDHAANVAWRIQKDWVEAQLAKVQCGMSEMSEVFMPYLITNDGSRLFEKVSQSGFGFIEQK